MQPNNPNATGVRKQFDRLSPKHKQWAVMALGFIVLVIVAWPMINDKSKPIVPRKSNDLSTMVTSADPRNLGITAVNGDVKSLQTQVDALTRAMERMTAQNGQSAPAAVEGLREQLNTLKGQVAEQRNGLPAQIPPGPPVTNATPASTQPARTPVLGTPTATLPPSIGAPGAPGLSTTMVQPPPTTPPRIVTTGGDSSDAPSAAAKAQKAATEKAKAEVPRAYIPSGSMLTGVLINGIDAPTGRGASGQPQPVLVRIKREAILPNRFRADVRECFAILAGYGDLSSERAILRAESFSCVRRDGKVIDTKLEMYAVGEDGKSGVRGRLVSKQGSAIAKAMVAGFAQSYAQALSPSYGGSFGGSFGGGSGGANGNALQNGAYGGASSALDRVAKFYIDLANQMFPVVEVDAGRPVTLVVLHGGELALASK